jgi:hypothetical protein
MNEERITEGPSRNYPRGQVMKTPDDVAEMLRLLWNPRVVEIRARVHA